MNAKEKANELYNKMLNSDIMDMTSFCAKQCALIAVEEILKSDLRSSPYETKTPFDFWNDVKKKLMSF